jgi:hypothetical protein
MGLAVVSREELRAAAECRTSRAHDGISGSKIVRRAGNVKEILRFSPLPPRLGCGDPTHRASR